MKLDNSNLRNDPFIPTASALSSLQAYKLLLDEFRNLQFLFEEVSLRGNRCFSISYSSKRRYLCFMKVGMESDISYIMKMVPEKEILELLV